jgi:hypothetical protein
MAETLIRDIGWDETWAPLPDAPAAVAPKFAAVGSPRGRTRKTKSRLKRENTARSDLKR